MDRTMKELEHNLNCNRVRSVIDDLMTDDMPPSVASHVTECRDCRDHAKTNARLRELVRDSHRVTAPADFDVRLGERLQIRTSKPRSFWAFVPTPALAAAATFVITAAITFTVLKHMHGNSDGTVNPVNAPPSTIAQVDSTKPETAPVSSQPAISGGSTSQPIPTSTIAFGGR